MPITMFCTSMLDIFLSLDISLQVLPFQVVCCGASLEPNMYLSLLGRSNGRNTSKNERRRKQRFWELEGALLWLQINSLTFCKYYFILNIFCKYFHTVLPTLVKRSFSALNFVPKSLYNSIF